jgi:hypothetical protein
MFSLGAIDAVGTKTLFQKCTTAFLDGMPRGLLVGGIEGLYRITASNNFFTDSKSL